MTSNTTLDDLDNKELPGDWEAGIGERHDGAYYTRFYYHPDYELRVYWDDGQDHTVCLRPKERREGGRGSGYGYPVMSFQFGTERDAVSKAHELMHLYPED